MGRCQILETEVEKDGREDFTLKRGRGSPSRHDTKGAGENWRWGMIGGGENISSECFSFLSESWGERWMTCGHCGHVGGPWKSGRDAVWPVAGAG